MNHSQEVAVSQKTPPDEQDLWRCGDMIDWKRSDTITQMLSSHFDAKLAFTLVSVGTFTVSMATSLCLETSLTLSLIFSGTLAGSVTAFLGSLAYYTTQAALESELSQAGQQWIGQRFMEREGVESHPHECSFYQKELLAFKAGIMERLNHIEQARQQQGKPRLVDQHSPWTEFKVLSETVNHTPFAPTAGEESRGEATLTRTQAALNSFSIRAFKISQALLGLIRQKSSPPSLSDHLTAVEAEELFRHCRPEHYALHERQILGEIMDQATPVAASVSTEPSKPQQRRSL